MNPRARLRSMIPTSKDSRTVWAEDEVTQALDDYRRDNLLKAIGRILAIPVQCTALTGPVWYGNGWNEAITQFEEIADYQAPDDEAYVGELERLRALALNVRAAVRRGDLAHVQQLSNQHRQADTDARNKAYQKSR